MIKRFLVLTLTVAILLTMLMPVSHAWFYMYVYTANGKTLNVRSAPTGGDNVIGQLKYGEEVAVDYHLGNGWTALMGAGAYSNTYVQTKFLVYDKPGPKPKPNPTPATDTSGEAAAIEAEFKAARLVTPYSVVTQNTRASGFVNLRWAPFKKAQLIQAYRNGVELEVIAELKDWRQVRDPATGAVGFIRYDFLARK